MYYPCSEIEGSDQLRSYCEADLRLYFRIGINPVFSRCDSIINKPHRGKTNNLVSEHVRHKPGCAATEDG